MCWAQPIVSFVKIDTQASAQLNVPASCRLLGEAALSRGFTMNIQPQQDPASSGPRQDLPCLASWDEPLSAVLTGALYRSRYQTLAKE